MEQKPTQPNKLKLTWRFVISVAVGAAIGIIALGILTNLLGLEIPGPAIGGAVGAVVGLIIGQRMRPGADKQP
ncbi:MAG: hypothetical protein L0332_09105 [Chloroflexi bacterium]|nr:hypothetical protein [Chloroflexota bacterium]MCI0576750.1 hypothetical protein [Chloroflexota bacterium]MCI0645988.1 hypothetical protein [Chloroflexota bacterium]MCI0726863.1 hypothetical protein [Chloroflexota bacterium]